MQTYFGGVILQVVWPDSVRECYVLNTEYFQLFSNTNLYLKMQGDLSMMRNFISS